MKHILIELPRVAAFIISIIVIGAGLMLLAPPQSPVETPKGAQQ
jgi:hypothetical protein